MRHFDVSGCCNIVAMVNFDIMTLETKFRKTGCENAYFN